jgi:hypothetical protein
MSTTLQDKPAAAVHPDTLDEFLGVKPAADGKTAASPEGKAAAEPKPGESPDGKAKPKGEEKPDASKEKKEDEATLTAKLDKANAAYRELQSKSDKEKARLEKQMTALQEDIAVLNAKLDGTYVEPDKPTPEQEKQFAGLQAKVKASKALAYKEHGQETVDAQVFADEAPYKKLEQAHPWMLARCLHSEHPIQEALSILKEQEVFDTLGRDIETIRKKIEDELRPKLTKEILKQAKDGTIQTGKEVPGLGQVRSAGGGSAGEGKGAGKSAFDLNTLSVG